MRRWAWTLLVAACSLSCAKKELSRLERDQTRPPAEWMKLDPVRTLAEYVRLDTSPTNGEEAGARFLERFFECDGIETEIVCPAPKRCNLLARLPGRRREGALLLLSHIDVAPVVPDQWKEASPFSAKIRNGYLYGRGSYDMKAIAVAQAYAVRHLKRAGIVPATDILVLAEADEETHQKWGSRWLLEHRPEWFRGVAEVLNEGGTNEMILRNVRFWGLETLEAGYAFAELENSAERPLKDLVARWPKLKSDPVRPDPQVLAGFELVANQVPMPMTDSLRHPERVLRDPVELESLPDRFGAFFQARIHWFGPYRYPSGTFRTFVIVSVPPGFDPDGYMRPILADASRSGVGIVRSESSGLTNASPYPTPFTEMLRRITEAHFPGVPFGPMPTFGGYTTSILFRRQRIPTYGFLPIPMNITDSARRHGNDERIFLRDYVQGLELYREVVEEFAAVR